MYGVDLGRTCGVSVQKCHPPPYNGEPQVWGMVQTILSEPRDYETVEWYAASAATSSFGEL